MIVASPAGVENLPLPNETRPEAVIRKRCPFRTTRPLLVQPLLALSARTPTFIVKKVGAAAVVVVLVAARLDGNPGLPVRIGCSVLLGEKEDYFEQ